MGTVPFSGSNQITINTATMRDILEQWLKDTAPELLKGHAVVAVDEQISNGATVYEVRLGPGITAGMKL